MPTTDPFPSFRTRRLFAATDRQIRILAQSVDRYAGRRGDQPVPPAILADAAALLRNAKRLLSREPFWPARLEPIASHNWAELASQLTFAIIALVEFREFYIDVSWDEVEPDAPL